MPDADLVLAVLLVTGDVVGDRVIEVEEATLSQFVDDEGGDGLGGGVHAKRCVDGRRYSLGVMPTRLRKTREKYIGSS